MKLVPITYPEPMITPQVDAYNDLLDACLDAIAQ
jgi:hypothetical protein